MIIGIDHGYYAIKTKQVCFPTGLMRYTYEPYTMQNVLQYGGAYYVCGTGRQALVKDKTANDNYYLLTLAALAQEIRKRKRENCQGCSCSRASSCWVWKGKTEIQGISVSERTARPLFLRRGTL